MKLRREASLGIGAILTLQILLSMLAIALLTRMGPAIERILEENVYSGEAVEEMMALLATQPEPGPVPEGFDDALRRAQDNVTEEPERPLLATIERESPAAFAGDGSARRDTVRALRQLGQVNRDSMSRADAQAKRMGQAGAWAAALLGALALALGIIVYRRLRLRLELPIEELRRTTQRVRAGNLQARCPAGVGPHEVKQIASDLNWMLDRWLHEGRDDTPAGDEEREAEVRRVLAWLLDRQPTPAAILNGDGRKIAANQAAMTLDVGPSFSPDGSPEGVPAWTTETIPGTALQLATLSAASTAESQHAAPTTTQPEDPS